MKTPMQEMVKWLDNIIAVIPDQSVGVKNQMIIAKLKAESLLEKERGVMEECFDNGDNCVDDGYGGFRQKWKSFEHYYSETFNTKEK